MATNPFGFGPMGLPSKASQAEDPATKKSRIDALAVKTQVPANVLLAFDERGENVEAKATEIGAWLQGGRKMEEVVPADVMGRAYDIADALYPRAPEPAPAPKEPSKIRDFGNVLGSSLIKGAESIYQGAAVASDLIGNGGTSLNPETSAVGNVFRALASERGEASKRFMAAVSPETLQAMADSAPDGDPLDPSTWTLGKSPSALGYAMLATDVFGSFATTVAAGVLAGPVGAAAAGGLQGGGAASQTAERTIAEMATTPHPDGGMVIDHESSYFKFLIKEGVPREEAIRRTTIAAQQAAFTMTMPVSALGGAATSKIVSPGHGLLAGQGMAARVAGTGALSALEEGSQEAVESMATKAGINTGAGTDLSLTEGTVGDFILGALGGGPLGAASGIPAQQTRDDGSVAGEAGASETTPPGGGALAPAVNPKEGISPLGLPGQEGGAAGLPTPPLGPLSEIAAVSPDLTPQPEAASRFPDQKPGKEVRLVDPETGVIHDAVVLGETPEGISVRIAGGEVVIDPATFDAARLAAGDADTEAAGKPKKVKRAPKNAVQPSEQPAPPVVPGVDDAAAEALRQQGFYDLPADSLGEQAKAGTQPKRPPEPPKTLTPDEALKRAKIVEGTAARGGWTPKLKKKHAEFMAIAGEQANAQTPRPDDVVGSGAQVAPEKQPDIQEAGQTDAGMVADGRAASPAGGGRDQSGVVPDGGSAGQPAAVAPQSSTGLVEAFGSMGKAMGDGYVDMLFDAFSKGKTTDASGSQSNALKAAKRIKEYGGTVTRENMRDIAESVDRIMEMPQDQRGDAASALVMRYAPKQADGKITSAPTSSPDDRIQPDMLGGNETTETEMATKERRRKEWGRFLAIVEGGKSSDDSSLEGRDVLIRGTRVIIRAKNGAGSDQDYRLDTEGMDRDTVAARVRGALQELDRRAPLDIPPPQASAAPVQAPAAVSPPQAAGATEAPSTQEAAPTEIDSVILKDGSKGRLARINLSKHADGWRASYDYDIQGLAGGGGAVMTADKGKAFQTKEAAIAAGKASIARSVADIADGRAGSATATHVAKAKKIVKWAAGDAEAGTNGTTPGQAPSVPATTGLLSVLSAEKQARAAELSKKLADKARNQTSSGLDPEYITLGGELVKLYLEAGVKKFGQMLRDFAEQTGLTLKQAQEPMRAAYNHVRDNMDLEGLSIEGMDDAAAVLDEARAAIKGDVPPPPPTSPDPAPTTDNDKANEPSQSEVARRKRVADHEAWTKRREHAQANLVVNRVLPGRQALGVPMASIEVGPDLDGGFMVSFGYALGGLGKSSPFEGGFKTAREAEASAEADIRASVTKVIEKGAESGQYSDRDISDAKKISAWLGDEGPVDDAATASARAAVEAYNGVTVDDIREKAAVLRGLPKDRPPNIPNVSLKWDDKEGGFIFSRKHKSDVLLAAMLVEEDIAAEMAQSVAPTRAEVDAAAAETNPNPTPAQAEAENYRTGKVDWHGLTLSIENAKGSVRRKMTPDGKTAWEVTMPADYGRILGTTGADGDHVDFYMGETPESDAVFVIDQRDAKTGRFDEIKIILGSRNVLDAFLIYTKGFSDGRGEDRAAAISETTVEGVKQFLRSRDSTGSFAGAKGAAWSMPSPTLSSLAERDGSLPQPAQSALPQLRGARDNDSSAIDEFYSVSGRSRGSANDSPPTGPGGQRSGVSAGQPALADEEGTGAQYAQEPPSDGARRNQNANRMGGPDELGSLNDPLSAGSRDERRGRGADSSEDKRQGLKSTSTADLSPKPEKPATIEPPSAKESIDEQPRDQGSNQGFMDFGQSGGNLDAAGSGQTERGGDGRGEGDQDGTGENAGPEPTGGMERDPGRVSDSPEEPRVGEAPPNFTITDTFALGEGTDGQKLEGNLAALRLVKTLEAENRYATPEEQATLARWVGWGGLKTVFDEKHKGTTSQWGRAQAELKTILTRTEYFDAMRSTADAHYTSRVAVDAMWQAMRNFGFTGGRALEPTIGSGNFLGLQPTDIGLKTEWFASEIDSMTGRVVKHLYPRATVFDGMGFQDAPFRRATFDIAIGNPPFGGDASRVGNAKMHPDLGRMKVHNFVIAKTGQLLREGGIMGMVVTHRFLDAMDAEARDVLAPNYHFLGAVRLPNTAFKANAGTEVTTDIVFFQKRRAGDDQGDTSWLDVGASGPNGTTMNAWFAANPDMILGRAAMDGTMYAGGRKEGGEFTVHDDGRDLAEALAEAMGKIKASLPSREQALEDAVTAPKTVSTLGYGEMVLTADNRVFRGDVSEDGAAKVDEITAETFWRDNAAAQFDLVEALRPFAEGQRDLGIESSQKARNAAVTLGLMDLAGDPVSVATKFEQEMADAIPSLLFGTASKAQRDAYVAYAKRVESKRLGSDGFDRLKSILDLRGRVKALIRAERNDEPPMEQIRGGLRQAYQSFRNTFGFLNNSKNEAILQGDVGPEMALEVKYKAANKEGRAESAEEAPILSKRVIFPHKLPEDMDSVADAMHVSMQERGYVDPALIAGLTNTPMSEVIAELTGGDTPMAFKNPATSKFEPAEVYLSGNLAEKIERAKTARAFDHIPHLKAALPAPKTQEQITASIRSMWIPRDVFEEFLRALGYQSAKVSIMEKVGMVGVDYVGSASTEFGQQFKTDRIDPGQVFEHAIKGKIPVIYDTIRENGNEKRIKNEEATKDAVASYERMSAEFPNWAYANPMRAAKIIDAFNEKVNVVTPRKYEGTRYLRTVGTSPLVQLRNSQKNGAWRMVQDRMVLLHHVVGAGKTMTGITGVMERKRMGLTRKAVVVVPNHLTGQWGKEWLELYPAANILVPTEKDFDPANRSKLINRIATGDFDAVIIGHSQLVKIDNDPDLVRKYIEDEMEALNDAMQEQKRNGDSKRTVSQMGARIRKLRDRLTDLNKKIDERRGSGMMSWKELGVDYMVLDESQEFKNLEYSTSATKLVGMNNPGGSQKAFDLLMKIRVLQASQSGGVTFMTGTPISNSLVEIYSVMKYLIPESMDSMGIKHFDAWKSAFIQDESRFEYTASMQLKERNVMSGMVNLGPLAELYRSFSDIVMRPDVERMYREQMEAQNAANPTKQVSTRFPTPKVKGGKRRILLAAPTPRMEEFTRYLVTRMAGIKNAPDKKKYASIDNPLWVLTDARKASVDIRTIDPAIGREEGSKVTRSSAEVFRIWKANTDRIGTQLVFCDMSTPSKNAEKDAKGVLKAAYGKLGLKGDDLRARIERDDGRTFAARWADLFGEIEEMSSSAEITDSARDRLTAWLESPDVQDASAAMFTADTGFSFYDDMKAMLVEKGIPEAEIAFIHDYNTPLRKTELFEAVNAGKIRVLIGSTMKMGAGTNAQRRLVALHHIDAPWRPSDMEQREGRIIRQGNLFYEQDPEGFEVEILAYSTQKTSDVVQWQVLERKAKAIETFLGAAADSLQEEGGDADQYAEFMAQSTGKKVFLQKMQVEKDLIKARGAISSALRSRAEAGRFIENYEAEQAYFAVRKKEYSRVTADLFPAGASDYMAEWRGLIEAYRVERDKIEAENEQIRNRNVGKPRKEWEKLLENPNAPQRWRERPTNEWEAKVYDALTRAANTRANQSIGLGNGFEVEVVWHAPVMDGGPVSYTAHLVSDALPDADIPLTEGFGVAVKDFRNSDKLLSAFDPANILFRAEQRARAAANRLVDHAAMLPKMQDLVSKRVDESQVKDLEVKLASLSAETRIEEVKYAEESAKLGSNHFVEIDNKGRDLRGDTSTKPLTGQFQFKNAGRTYASEWGAPAGRRRIEGTEKWGDVAYFEAEDMASGDQVIIEATQQPKEEGQQEGSWVVNNVFERADDGSMEMRDAPSGWGEVDADPEITEADIMAITRDLNAEMELTGLAGKVNVRVVRELYSLTTGNRIFGRFDQGTIKENGRPRPFGQITVESPRNKADADANFPKAVLRHEIIHALRSETLWNRKGGLFTEAEWSELTAAARAEPGIVASVMERYPHLQKPGQVEEMVAELYRLWMDNRDGYSGVERAMLKIEGFLTALANLLRGKGFVSAARVMEQIATGRIGGRGPQGPNGGRRQGGEVKVTPPALSNRVRDALGMEMRPGALPGAIRSKFNGLIGSKHWKNPGELMSNVLTDAMAGKNGYSALALVPGRALFAELGKRLPSSKIYLRLKEEMDALRNDWHSKADATAQEWRKARAADPRANDDLMDLMHRSTLSGVDPSRPDTWKHAMGAAANDQISRYGDNAPKWAFDVIGQVAAHERAYAALQERFALLPKPMQDIYRKVRANYDRLGDDFERAVLDNIETSMKVAMKRAERAYKKEMDRIRDEGLTGDEKDIAMAEAKETLDAVKKRGGWGAKAKISALRKKFESNRLKGPYFPLARFGQFFVTIRNHKGEVVSFSRFEKEAQQQAFIRQKKEDGAVNVQYGVLSDSAKLKGQVDPTFVADIEGMLADSGASDQVMDAIWQRWLETLPDQSIRTSKIHRKGREGWNSDAFRAFGHHMFHGAHQLARLKFGLPLEEALNDADEEAKAALDPNRSGLVVNEMRRRHEFTMNPKGSSAIAAVSGMAFVWYLGATPASAVANLSQTTVIGPGVMASRFKTAGITGSIAAIGKAAKDFAKGKGEAQKSPGITQDEHAAMTEAYRRGTIDKTQAHDLASVAETGIEYNSVREAWMRKIGWMFHHAERFNREVTFLAAYRLARGEGATHADAIDAAADTTWTIHFDYQNCVDDQTEILTIDGWKMWNQVKAGDRILSTDDTGMAVEIGVQEVNVFHRPQEIALFEAKGTRRFSMAVTDDHKCVAVKESKSGGKRGFTAPHFVEAKSLDQRHHLLRAPLAPLDRPESIGTDMAALIGWFAAEGWYARNRGAKEKNNVRLEQSLVKNPEHVAEIDGILSRLGPGFSRGVVKQGRHVLWSLSGPLAKAVQAAVPDKLLPWSLLATMSAHEMSALLDAFVKGDGNRKGKNDCITITQKGSTNRQNLEVLQAMATALGKTASIGDSATRDMSWLTMPGNGRIQTTKTAVAHLERKRLSVPMVWCPTTDNGRWIARRNGCVFVTGNTSRPRIMQNDLGKIATIFRNYTVNLAWRMFRDAHQSLSGATKEERAEARMQLVGTTLSMMLHAGIKGTYGYGIIMLLLSMFFPGDSDDIEEWLQDALLMEGDGLGAATWNYAMGAALNGVPGQLLGVDLTDRIGSPNLWFRGSSQDLEGADLYNHYVGEILGPTYGLGYGFFRGASMAFDDPVRAFEAAAPKILRDIVKTGRYAVEGVETMGGDDILESVNPYELLMQASGFTPARVSERFDMNTRLKNKERQITDERKGIHKQAVDAVLAGKPISQSVMDEISDFNRRFPEYPITSDTIRQSAQGRMRAQKNAEFGVTLNPKISTRLRDDLAPSVYN